MTDLRRKNGRKNRGELNIGVSEMKIGDAAAI